MRFFFAILIGFASAGFAGLVRAQPVPVVNLSAAEVDTPAGNEVEAFRPYQGFLNRKHLSHFYGQLNLGYLSYDDGGVTEGYSLIDNANSGSRIGFFYSRKLSDAWKMDARIELSWTASSTSSANITNREENLDREIYGLRHLDLSFENNSYGKFWIGQGAMASDGVSGVDFSGTNVIATSAVGDSAGGQFLRASSGVLTPLTIGTVFDIDNGLKRKVRLRYDTVDLGGFDLRFSLGKDLLNDDETLVYDIASTFNRDLGVDGDVKFRAAVSVAKPKDADFLLNGSASALHVPSGLSLTGALALERYADRTARYAYAKTGYQKDFFKIGRTALSLDLFLGHNVDVAASSSASLGLSFVQNLDRINAQFYGTFRSYKYARSNGDIAFENGVAVFSGMRLKF